MDDKVFDDAWNVVEDIDLERGEMMPETVDVECRYIVTQEATGHFETSKKYENGGEDVEWVEDTPELGAWHFFRGETEWPECPMEVPDDWPREEPVPLRIGVSKWRRFTAEELAEMAAKREEAEAKAKEAKDKAEVMDALPDAVADLSEVVSAQSGDAEGLADAVAELSQLVSDIIEKQG